MRATPSEVDQGKKPALLALTREISAAFERCELTHLERHPIDLARAREQHHAYEQALSRIGCELKRLPEEPEFPDSVFVEDAAVVLDGLAVVTRPGAVSRRGETRSIARALEPYRALGYIRSPGVLDGGDVLRVGKHLYVGRSSRTNSAGIEQLRDLVRDAGYSVTAVEFSGCLHLKSAATRISDRSVLINPDWVSPAVFDPLRVLTVDPAEPAAANALEIESRVVFSRKLPAHPCASPSGRHRSALGRGRGIAQGRGWRDLLQSDLPGGGAAGIGGAMEGSGPARRGSLFELITRENCHLCDEMKAVLDAEMPALGESYLSVDVDGNADLRARFGDTVPVLLRDGKPVAKVAIDREHLIRIVKRHRVAG